MCKIKLDILIYLTLNLWYHLHVVHSMDVFCQWLRKTILMRIYNPCFSLLTHCLYYKYFDYVSWRQPLLLYKCKGHIIHSEGLRRVSCLYATFDWDCTSHNYCSWLKEVFLVHLRRRLKCTIVITRLSSLRPLLTFTFLTLLWKCLTEFNETWQEARSQRSLPGLCFSDRLENKMAALAFDRLRHLRLLLWNCWTEFKETWQEARPQCRSMFVLFRPLSK